jgi:inosine/xanthosine triphosphate pyrophosphatase family protein/dephospho-CoA kinase
MTLAPILFATSNIGKFLQARLILGSAGFRVQRFEAHSRGYSEPYGLPTDQFLASGLQEVLSRAGRRKIVFIEDTTVRISALSDNQEDFPGQRTKEWFAESSHDQIMGAVNDRGGDLRASVRSDIALYIPGLKDFLFFSGVTQGMLALKPDAGNANGLYPWLGRNDFSSWFIPDGAMKTLASMSFDESRPYDFRIKAFEAFADRLAEYESILQLPGDSLQKPIHLPSPEQFALFPGGDAGIIVAIIGPLAAGKTTAGHHLALNREFRHVEGSYILSQVAKNLGITATDNFGLADKTFSQHGFDAIEREALEPLIDSYWRSIVYTGARTVEGLTNLKNMSKDRGRQLFIIFVSSSLSTRTARAIERGRNDFIKGSADDFVKRSERDTSYGAVAYGPMICDRYVRNDADIGKFLSKIDDVVASLEMGARGRFSRHRQRLLRALLDIQGGKLAGRNWIESAHPDLLRHSDDGDGFLSLSKRGSALLELLLLSNVLWLIFVAYLCHAKTRAYAPIRRFAPLGRFAISTNQAIEHLDLGLTWR